MLSSIKEFLESLDNNNILYCHWKSNEHLHESLAGETDLDLLFDAAQRTQLERVFNACGLKRFRATPLMQYNAIEDYIGFDQQASTVWHVHTHYRLTLGESHLKGYTITSWGSLLLKDRVRGEENVWVSSPPEELVLLLCRISLKLTWHDIFRNLKHDDLAEFAWLKKRTTQESLLSAADRMVGEKSKRILLRLLGSELTKNAQFYALRRSIRKDIQAFTSYNRVSSWHTRIKREAFWAYGGIMRKLGFNSFAASRRVSPSGGLVVAVIGCDGAGKSTTVSYALNEFRKKIDVVAIYLGSGDGNSSLLRKPMKAIARKVGGKGVGHSVEKEYTEKAVSFKSRLYSMAKIIWAVALALEKKKKLHQLIKARNNGVLVLTDRYPQSTAPGLCDGPLLNRYINNGKGIMKNIAEWEHRVYELFQINPPDLAIKLIVPTNLAITRKPEMTVEEIERKTSIVKDMHISGHTVVIDSSRPFIITVGEVMKAIWDLI